MSISVKSIEKLLGETRVGFLNAKGDEEIKGFIGGYGYDDVQLDADIDLRTRLDDKYQEQQRLQDEQIIATRNFDEKYNEEWELLVEFRQLARVALRDSKYVGFRLMLGIIGKLRRNLEGFLKDGRQFYENAIKNETIMGLISKHGITVEKCQARLTGLDELKQLDQDQESKKGASQNATKERDSLYRELRISWGNFKQVCRIALKPKRQLLEKLGIVAPS
ncbi:MAG: hypothetical protein GTO45_11660 [Candidatus Aminicenantes bacterium]|nr:hypothetical protein [Candidatus Aminicenantes bacterium]NIM79461.1 hypothetical protein [Candidatus Aminicenantes bacterium]NIN18747.1 hypothetical protein [Candidatus Aminicenantes bacterium]NIN42669.1 hypothetical protein [Candidatus Aminicenantes bacterium]NIN85403.1 hypothetical protein [Candidatus Aminicenantes bacterium]